MEKKRLSVSNWIAMILTAIVTAGFIYCVVIGVEFFISLNVVEDTTNDPNSITLSAAPLLLIVYIIVGAITEGASLVSLVASLISLKRTRHVSSKVCVFLNVLYMVVIVLMFVLMYLLI